MIDIDTQPYLVSGYDIEFTAASLVNIQADLPKAASNEAWRVMRASLIAGESLALKLARANVPAPSDEIPVAEVSLDSREYRFLKASRVLAQYGITFAN